MRHVRTAVCFNVLARYVVGYARVSTQDQHLTGQLEALKAAGAETIYREKISGVRADRPQLAKLMASLKPGDIVQVTKLDRLGRSTRELLDLIEQISKAGASFRSLGDPLWDTSSSQGRLLSTLLAVNRRDGIDPAQMSDLSDLACRSASDPHADSQATAGGSSIGLRGMDESGLLAPVVVFGISAPEHRPQRVVDVPAMKGAEHGRRDGGHSGHRHVTRGRRQAHGRDLMGNPSPNEPPDIPPPTPGHPTEPPPDIPPGNPNPEAPPPLREPGEAPVPDELPGNTPDEFPTRGRSANLLAPCASVKRLKIGMERPKQISCHPTIVGRSN